MPDRLKIAGSNEFVVAIGMFFSISFLTRSSYAPDCGVVMITPSIVGSCTIWFRIAISRGISSTGASEPSMIKLMPKAFAATFAPT